MGKVAKWGAGILIFASIALAALVGMGYLILTRSLPGANGTALIAELGESVSVVRDREGVAHIEGKSIIDVAAAQGFVHAQERMWQMETLRMAGQGRLSEMFGEATINADIFLRTLGLAEHSRKSFEILAPETRQLLEAYARGVNAYLTRERRLLEPTLATEFAILGHQPEPWQAWQSLLSIKVMDLTLGSNLAQEINRLALASRGFEPREINDLLPHNPGVNPPPLPNLRKLFNFNKSKQSAAINSNGGQSAELGQIKLAYKLAYDEGLPWPIGVKASNNWVLSGERTQSGKVLLANDPHLGLTAPSTWYLVHLKYEEGGETRNLVGASLPSLPLILLGRNDDIAWGFTTSALDSQDLFIEKINPDNLDEYKTIAGWEKFGQETRVIKVANKPDVEFILQRTRHGPVLPMAYKNLKEILPEGHVAALKWAALVDDDTTLDALTNLAKAGNVSDAFAATKSMVSPMQTIVIGDNQGNTGMIAPARIPIRDDANQVRGRAPVPGWLAKYDWQGYLPFAEVPQFQNSKSGVFFSANSRFFDRSYPHHITYDWGSSFRHNRVAQLIADNTQKQNINDMIAAQADDYSMPLVALRDIALNLMPSGISTRGDIITALHIWNGKMTPDRAEPLIMIAWFKAISQALLADDLGDDFERLDRGNISILLNVLGGGGARDWCNNRITPRQETCSDIAVEGLKNALNDLEKRFGQDWRRWQWGTAHLAFGEHRPFANVSYLAPYFNVTVESGGGPYTLLRGQTDFGKDEPYYNRHGASYRAIYDFEDLEKSLYIHTTGQSGHFLSSFYDNFAKRWSNVEFIEISTKPAIYNEDALGIWKIERKNIVERKLNE